jgi:hypothetical protein
MSSLTASALAVKPSRTLRVLAPGLVHVNETRGKRSVSDLYRVTPIDADFGDGFEVAKVLAADMTGVDYAEPYHVNLSGATSTCECKGHLRHGHKTVCRHIALIRVLKNAGKL